MRKLPKFILPWPCGGDFREKYWSHGEARRLGSFSCWDGCFVGCFCRKNSGRYRELVWFNGNIYIYMIIYVLIHDYKLYMYINIWLYIYNENMMRPTVIGESNMAGKRRFSSDVWEQKRLFGICSYTLDIRNNMHTHVLMPACAHIHAGNIYIWVNYNDLTVLPHWKS